MTAGFLALLFFFPAGQALSLERTKEGSRWPHAKEWGAYQARNASTGKILWHVDWRTTVTQEADARRVEVVEEGRGQPWRYSEPITWEKRMFFDAAPQMQIRQVKGAGWTAEGAPLNQMEVRMDPGRGRIFYSDVEMDGTSRSEVFPFSPDVLPDELLFHWVRTLPFEAPPAEGPVHAKWTLLLSPTRRFRVDAQVKGTEAVITPAGTFSCYRVSLIPRLPAALRWLAPQMALWCTVEPPHHWVRYEGPVGGPGSPVAVIELVEFRQQE